MAQARKLPWAACWAKAKEHGGSLAAPARAAIGGYAIGARLAGLRAAAEVPAGEPGAFDPERRRALEKVDPERRRALEKVDPWWCPAWPVVWQRTSSAAQQWWLESDGRVDWAHLPLETEFEGEQLGRWVRAQRAGWAELDQEQRDLRGTLAGIEWAFRDVQW